MTPLWESAHSSPEEEPSHSRHGDEVADVERHVVHLGDEDGGDGDEQRRAVHVDGGADGQNEPADAPVHLGLLLDTLQRDGQRRRAVGDRTVSEMGSVAALWARTVSDRQRCRTKWDRQGCQRDGQGNRAGGRQGQSVFGNAWSDVLAR